MHCRNCGKEIADKAIVCVGCGAQPRGGVKYCQSCGGESGPDAEVCTKCGVKLVKAGGKEWLVTLLLCIFLGGLGIHRFYTGHTVIGIVQLLTLGLCGIWTLVDLILIIVGSFKDADGNELLR